MYRVMIVDDEPIIRLGVKASIPWEGRGYRLAGDYANGREALDAMELEPVDILITDIKMPVMDGFELIGEALKINDRLKVVLLSSYNEFEYARQGLKLGAVDYILKHTLQPEELAAVLDRCVEVLEREQGTDLAGDAAGSKRELCRRKRELAVRRLLFGGGKLPEADIPSLRFPGGCGLALLAIDNLEEIEQESGSLYSRILLDEMQELAYAAEEGAVVFPLDEGELVLLLSGPDAGIRLSGLKTKMELSLGIGLTAGFRVAAVGLEGELERDSMGTAFLQARNALDRRFLEGTGRLYEGQAAGRGESASGDELAREFGAVLQAVGVQAAESALARLRERWRTRILTPVRIRQEAAEALTLLWASRPEAPNLLDLLEGLRRSETLEQLESRLEAGIQEFRQRAERRLPEDGSDFIRGAIRYIGEHYTEELTLQSVSEHVHISKNYFCLMFKKETGQNFIDYVIALRVGKAKDLLAETNARIYEVAQQAGFNDVKYFSKLFKKLTDRSPVDYREMCRMNSLSH
ncbi:response regulator [Gorillibacterium massiliense]|uniref:response regulator n=1 Tax=Gorillibacterium massiliense TaxID=1280390 RepID=UPI0004BC0C21|nr:response regulator [Gorillibacterium massiliense]